MEENNNTGVQQTHVSDNESEDENIFERKSGCCIYKVPDDIRRLNEEAYTPQIVSIGPIHRNNPRLKKMEQVKKRYKKDFIQRTSKVFVEEFKSYITTQKATISACYDDDYFEGNSLENIVLTDVVFIFMLFTKYGIRETDFILDTPKLRDTVINDLLLLENQIPYFVLNELFKKLGDPNAFLKFALSLLFWGWDTGLSANSLQEISHFTDLYRRSLLIKFPPPNHRGPENERYIPSATKLHASGVVLTECKTPFQVSCKHEDGHLKLLPFMKTKQLVLRIPHLALWYGTEHFIRNVMAFEQFHYPSETHVCNFVDFMDYLINTDKDVELLVEKGILENNLGENGVVASMFNRLLLGHSVSGWHYSGIVKTLKEHNQESWNLAMAALKTVYFKDLWTGTGTVAAIVLLLLTFIQTVCSILQLL